MKKLWCDLRSDAERSDYILSGQAYDAGIIAHAIQADVAMAFHRCSEYDAEVRRLREENERLRENAKTISELEQLAARSNNELLVENERLRKDAEWMNGDIADLRQLIARYREREATMGWSQS